MFAIEVQTTFSAAHALRLPTGGEEPLHGHDFQVTVRITCDQLDSMDTVIDFHDIEALLDKAVGGWRNRNLNDCPPFRTDAGNINPSAERIAEHIATTVSNNLPKTRGVRISEVRITEASGCLAIWTAP